MIIRFRNWEKFQTATDIKKKCTWLKLHHDLANHQIWDELSGDGFKIYLFLLLQSSSNSPRGQTILSTRNVTRCCTTSEKEVYKTIKILKQFHVIETRSTQGFLISESEIRPRIEENREEREVEAKTPTPTTLFGLNLSPKGKDLAAKVGSIAIDQLKYEFATKGGNSTLEAKLDELATYLAVNPEKPIKNLASWVNNCLRRSGAPPPDDAPKEEPGKISSAAKRILEEIANERK